MTKVWLLAALWLALALAATLISIRLRVATAFSEIVVGTIAQWAHPHRPSPYHRELVPIPRRHGSRLSHGVGIDVPAGLHHATCLCW
jgi:hypothetical protein